MTNQFSAILSDLTEPVALFADFDGTLVEIASRPDAISVPGALIDRLRSLEVALGGAFAIISGRTISDIDGFLAPATLTISGSHGAELRHSGTYRRPPSSQSGAADLIGKFMSDEFGDDDRILVERKPAGVAVHYRAAPERGDDVRLAMHRALEDAEGFHAIEGKKVIEARPEGTDKGKAITGLMHQPPFKGRLPVFLGDDVTDEDGFRSVNTMGGISIKVGTGATAARFRIPDVTSVFQLLNLIAEQQMSFAGDTHFKEAFK